jgi:hypothetical protein
MEKERPLRSVDRDIEGQDRRKKEKERDISRDKAD